jgi:hypothetical protein
MLEAPLNSEPSVPFFAQHRKTGERFHRNRLLLFVRDQDRVLRTTDQAPGTIRRLWQNLAGYVGTGAGFSWTANSPGTGVRKIESHVSTPLRYLVSTVDVLTAGNQRSMPMRRPQVPPRVAHTAPSVVMAGNVGYRPTVRSRIPSFGSRVPALNQGYGIAGTE